MNDVEIFNDSFQNYKVYGLPKAQLILTDVPYLLGKNAYASNPSWYIDGDNANGESDKVVIIDPATLGQFTGLTDYNGNDIYEGDILDISAINLPSRAIVAYRGGAFVLTDVDGCVIDPIYGYDTDAFEVIGNIHDNPELLDVEND